MSTNERIEQFQNMVEADPDNELAHFSLGQELMKVERFAEAAREFKRTVELRDSMSKAYELLGESLKAAGDNDSAVEWLQKGYQVANDRGDNLPKMRIAELLGELGGDVPEPAAAAAPAPVDQSGGWRCQRCLQPNPQLANPPMNDDVGKQIAERICEPCWREWLLQGVKVINELRLNLADPTAQQEYDNHMKMFLNIG